MCLVGVQETMTGSTSLVAAMTGDVKKAAQMLDTLAPEVSITEFPKREGLQLNNKYSHYFYFSVFQYMQTLYLHCFLKNASDRKQAKQGALANRTFHSEPPQYRGASDGGVADGFHAILCC